MRSLYVTFFLLHNKLLQVAIWLAPWTVSKRLLKVFGLLGVPCVPEHGIRAAFGFDQDLEPVLPKL